MAGPASGARKAAVEASISGSARYSCPTYPAPAPVACRARRRGISAPAANLSIMPKTGIRCIAPSTAKIPTRGNKNPNRRSGFIASSCFTCPLNNFKACLPGRVAGSPANVNRAASCAVYPPFFIAFTATASKAVNTLPGIPNIPGRWCTLPGAPSRTTLLAHSGLVIAFIQVAAPPSGLRSKKLASVFPPLSICSSPSFGV